jgi:hypothetical protein
MSGRDEVVNGSLYLVESASLKFCYEKTIGPVALAVFHHFNCILPGCKLHSAEFINPDASGVDHAGKYL